MVDERNYSLLPHNTFNIDVRCRRFVEVDSVEDAVSAVTSMTSADYPFLVIGQGSNILFTRDYEGTIIRSAIKGMQVIDLSQTNDVKLLRCGSGERWDDVVQFCINKGLYGAENLSLIPGDVGASAVQNIGAYGSEVKDIIESVEAIDLATGEIKIINAADCNYGYRKSRFKTEWKGRYLITNVTYRLSKTFTPNCDYGRIHSRLETLGVAIPTANDVRKAVVSIRTEMLPDTSIEGNAGSFFVNPVVSRSKFNELLAQWSNIPHYDSNENGDDSVKIPAGWLIEQCGWKGKTMGRAGVHSKQALVLVNKGNASGEEIVHLCNAICKDVEQRFGIKIYPEVNII